MVDFNWILTLSFNQNLIFDVRSNRIELRYNQDGFKSESSTIPFVGPNCLSLDPGNDYQHGWFVLMTTKVRCSWNNQPCLGSLKRFIACKLFVLIHNFWPKLIIIFLFIRVWLNNLTYTVKTWIFSLIQFVCQFTSMSFIQDSIIFW